MTGEHWHCRACGSKYSCPACHRPLWGRMLYGATLVAADIVLSAGARVLAWFIVPEEWEAGE